MRSAALTEARAKGLDAFPICAVDLVARGLSLGRGIYSPAMRATALGQATQVTRPGGWGEIVYGSGVGQGRLDVVEATVEVSDPRGELVELLETYGPHGSAARIDWAAPGLVSEDWEPVFRGILFDWERDALFTKLVLHTDDTVLRIPIPKPVVQQTEWGSAYDATIFGEHNPLVLGIHNSYQITARGMVPLINLRYDKDQGYWWGLSSSRMVTIDRLYFDGVPQGAGGWTVAQGVFGGAFWTIVQVSPGYQPAQDVIVACDCKGPDASGRSTGDTLTGAPDQLRAILEEWAYRTAPLGDWRGPHSIIDAESWDAASEFFALHKIESARRLGADQNTQSAAELIQSFLDAYPWARIYWTPLGTLAFTVIDPDDVEPDDSAWLRIDKHVVGGQPTIQASDSREVYTHVRMPYCWGAADAKFENAYEAHDVAALPETVLLTVENPWSQARPTQDGVLNPAPPDDPVPPS